MAQRALITGVTGQDGSYLAELLLAEGYEVIGVMRRSSTVNMERIGHLQDRLTLVQGDLMDESSLIHILREHRPHEVYNLAAQSFVQASWTQPVLTGETTALGVTRMLDAIRIVDPEVALLPGELLGDVRPRPRGPPDRGDAVLPPQPLRGGQGLRPLDHRQLPRELRPARDARASCSTTARRAGASSSSSARSPTASRASSSGSTRRWASATSTPSATGATPPTTCARCGRCCAATRPTTSSWRPARRTRCASCARSRSPRPGCATRTTWWSTSGSCARPRSTCSSGDATRARRELDWKCEVDFYGLVEMMVAADLAALAR